jgi:hypothetical protein
MFQDTKQDKDREEVFGELPESPMEVSDPNLPRSGRHAPMANQMLGGTKSQLTVFLFFIAILLLIIFVVF